MGRAWVFLMGVLLAGCDFAVAAVVGIMESKPKKATSASPPSLPPPTSYFVWVANIPNAATATAQQSQMASNGGNPDPAVWSQVGEGTGTAVFQPSGLSFTPNAVLIQATSIQNYHIDAIEFLDSSGTVVATASLPTYSAQVTNPNNIAGPPDGTTALTTAAGPTNAFIFTITSVPFVQIQVSLWAGAPSSGDLQWVSRFAGGGNVTPGGFDLGPSGAIFVTVSDWTGTSSRNIRLVQFSPAGAFVNQTDLALGVNTATGSHGLAIDSSGHFFIAMTIVGGLPGETDIQVMALHSDFSTLWGPLSFGTASMTNLVQWNSVALDGSGNPIVAGGVSNVATGIDHWMTKFSPTSGSAVWTQTVTTDTANTYWYAVAADGADQVYSAGNLTSTTLGKIQMYARKTSPANSVLWSQLEGTGGSNPDQANAIAVDGSGNVFAGGFFGTSTGREAALVKLTPQGVFSSAATHLSRDNLNAEILGVAADTDGTVYVAGYETLSGPNENMWIRKYDPSGSVVWTRTYDGGFQDRAVAIRIVGSTLLVVGYEGVSSTASELHVRSYVK